MVDFFAAPLSPVARLLLRAGLMAGPVVLWMLTNDMPPWGDEEHFLLTVRLFGNGLSRELLRTYPEMSGPLTFAAFSVWGHIAGFDTPALRLLAPLIASVTALLWYETLRRAGGDTRGVALALLVVLLNPYFVGLSVFVFTDMPALLGMSLLGLGVVTGRPLVVCAGLIVATLARQYLVFLAPALVTAEIAGRWSRGRVSIGPLSIAAVVGLLPLGVMVLLWGGHLAPDNAWRPVYLSEGLRFDLHALTLYLALPAIYLAPLLAVQARRPPARVVAVSTLLAALAMMFPVQPSVAQTREGSHTVGFADRFLSATMPASVVDVFFAVMVLAGGVVIGTRLVRDLRTWRAEPSSLTAAAVFPWLAALSFLLVMPFSYMPWEKYGLPLLMLIAWSTSQHPSAPPSTLQHLSAPFSTSQHPSAPFSTLQHL
ncbi:MAG: hypothetical protein IT178_18110 [Acidobacteria bacterium]|nr:hypothetical protein [Acidobacteriota bacterium]